MDDDFNSYDFDKILAKIQEESLRHYNEVELPRAAALKEQEQKKNLNVSEGDLFKSRVKSKDGDTSFTDNSQPLFHHGDDAEGFHYAAGKTYIYPSNYPVRKYQADIVPTALFHNTLVSLPTGLGKTFIAAVVMYNFYRWYPMGKVIFMAPTRPLVTQQLSACRDIMGIPVEDTVELTGSTTSGDRKVLWNLKRVFYLTPQVLMNDLRSNLLQAATIKCLVIDEAHRATKGYAYCQVVKILFEENVKFRILALSATPGTDANAVKDVILNLHIEKLEVRSEDSEDVVEYSHTKSVIPIVVDLPAFLRDIWNQYMLVYENYVRKIRELKVVNQNVATMTKFQMLTAFRKFTSRPPSTLPKNVVQSINGDFTSCITLAHGRELLQTYGLRTFHSYFTDAENSNDKAASITRLSHDKSFRQLLGAIEEIIFKEDNGDSRQYNWSHPKMEHLVSVVREHFEIKAQAGENTKAIIFCQYRLVVTEVYEIMKKFVPHAKPVMFIGQSSKEKGQGLPQKKQIEVMKMFRSGEYNVMIATSVAEEGLDIGDVDLIVSMETHRSPIKLVQRFGRTGRKRNGRCVVLLTSGSEVKKFNEVMSTQKNYTSIISAPGVRASLEESSPRMVPQNCNPKLQLLHIKVPKSDKRKQCDIRNVFGRLDTSRMHAPAAVSAVPTSAFLTDEELAEVRDELGSYFPNFNRLPQSSELWPRRRGSRLEIEEFASDKFSGYSDWLDWNNDLQETHVVGHSRDTKMLVDLLQKASEIKERIDRPDEPVDNLIPSPPTSLWSTVGTNQNQKKKNEGGKKVKTNGKIPAKSKHGLDIRECLAKVPPKLGFISQDSSMSNEFLVPNKRHATYSKHVRDISGDNVILVDDDLDRMLGDILNDFPNILGKKSYCSLSKNKEIRSVVMKCVTRPKYQLNIEILPDISELLKGVTIDDVNKLDVTELPCFKSTSSSKNHADFGNVNMYRHSSTDNVDAHSSSPLNKQVDYDRANKESNVDVREEDASLSPESSIVGIDDIFKSFNISVENDGKCPLKDCANFDSPENKIGCSEFEEEELSPILSQRPRKTLKGLNGKVVDNSTNLNLQKHVDVWDRKGGENELSPILSQKPQKTVKAFSEKCSKVGLFKDEELEGRNRFDEKDLSPLLSQKHQKTMKIFDGKCSNVNFLKDERIECGSRSEEKDLSPILSQRPIKTSNVFNGKRLNSISNINFHKDEMEKRSGFDEKDLSPILSQKHQKSLNVSDKKYKRKLEVENFDKVLQPECSKDVDKCAEIFFENNQAFDTAFFDEFSDDMLAKLSPIPSCKTEKIKKPEDVCRSREILHELSPILSQAGKNKFLSKIGENVGMQSTVPNLTSSTPKSVKKDLFQNQLQNVKKSNLPSVKEADTCKNSDLDYKMSSEIEKNDEDEIMEDDEEVWGIDQILGSSKCEEEKSSSVTVQTPSHSPKRLSYYMEGSSLYSVTQLVEKAVKLEKDGHQRDKINNVEEKQVSGDKIDEFLLNSSDDDLFDCADSKLHQNFEVEKFKGSSKLEEQFNVAVNKSKPSIIEISDGGESVLTKSNTLNENNRKENIKEVLNDDEDFFEITGLDELMQNCFDNNLEKSKSPETNSKPSTSARHLKTSELKMDIENMDSEEDELIKNCLDDNFINNLGKSKSPEIDLKLTVPVGNLKASNLIKSKSEKTGKSTPKEVFKTVSDLPAQPEKLSTQFKSDYLSNEELEELLKSGMFSDSADTAPKSKPEVKLSDLTENIMNDTEIIDDSNEFCTESPILLSYRNKSLGKSSCNTKNKSMKDDNCPKTSIFPFLSKSKSKGGLKVGKENQSKPSLAPTNSQTASLSWSSLDLKGSSRSETKIKDKNSDESFSWGSPTVQGTRKETNTTEPKISDESFSWGSPKLVKGTRQEDDIETKYKESDKSVSKQQGVETEHRKSDESFSWETRDVRGCGQEYSEKESDNLKDQNEPTTSVSKDASVIHIDDESFASVINNCKRWKPKTVLSGSSTDMEEDNFPSIHSSEQADSKLVTKLVKKSTNSEARKPKSFKAPSKSSDTDDSSEIFITSINKKSDKSHDDSGPTLKSMKKKSKKLKEKKPNAFIENEADVSGDGTSSGKETSGLDSMDESFVDDEVNGDNTIMVAHYLETVKTPKNVAGGYRIPELSESVMARDVYSQYVPLEHETYVNDSFCVDESGSDESEMSELEIAEKLLAKRKKSRKHKKTKRKRQLSTSGSATDSHPCSSQESRKSEEIKTKKTKKKRRIVILDDSDAG